MQLKLKFGLQAQLRVTDWKLIRSRFGRHVCGLPVRYTRRVATARATDLKFSRCRTVVPCAEDLNHNNCNSLLSLSESKDNGNGVFMGKGRAPPPGNEKQNY